MMSELRHVWTHTTEGALHWSSQALHSNNWDWLLTTSSHQLHWMNHLTDDPQLSAFISHSQFLFTVLQEIYFTDATLRRSCVQVAYKVLINRHLCYLKEAAWVCPYVCHLFEMLTSFESFLIVCVCVCKCSRTA